MKTDTWMQRQRTRARRLKQQYDQEQGEATVESLRRFRWMAGVTVPLHFILAAWFTGYPTSASRPEMVLWADTLSWVHAATGSVVLAQALFVHWLLQPSGRATAVGVALHVLLCITYLTFGVITSTIDVAAAAPGGLSAYIIVCIVVATLSIMRPLIALPLFLGGLLVLGLVLDASNSALLPSLVINAVVVTVMAMVTSLINWNQYVNNNVLRRELTAANNVLIANQKDLEFLSERDVLTGLYNRRRLLELLESELARMLRSPQDLSLVLMNLDNFERIHGRWGAAAGDEMLRQIAAMLNQTVRSTDLVARVGADDFMVLLPHTDRDNAVTVAEKIRERLRSMSALWPGVTVPVTASFGVTGLAFNELASANALYAAADRALYTAQQDGRDRVDFRPPQTSTQLSTFQKVRA